MSIPVMLTLAEAAERLHVSRTALRKILDAVPGALIRLSPRRPRVREDRVKAWLDKLEREEVTAHLRRLRALASLPVRRELPPVRRPAP